jgi:hypothetical protein
MLPTIGIMIGFYILTRMVSFILRGGDRSEPIIVKVLAVITGIVAILGILILSSSSGNLNPSQLR